MNAIKFILGEHRKIKKNLATISKGKRTEASKRKMFASLGKYLINHETMEQKIWYPYLKINTKLSVRIKHLISEEKSAGKAIKKMKKIKVQTAWDNKFATLKKDVLHHAHEEETKLFPKVKKQVDSAELDKLGKKLQTFHKKHSRIK